MQTTYQVTCRYGHAYPFPDEFLGPDGSRERARLLKALEGLPCPNCIRAAVEDTRALREDLQGIRSIPVKNPIAEELRRILDDETNECMHTK